MGAIFPLLSSHIWPRIWRSRKTGSSRRGGLCTEILPTTTDDRQTHNTPWSSVSLRWLSGWAQLLQKLSQSSLMLTPSRNLLWREFWKTVLFSQVDVLVSSVQFSRLVVSDSLQPHGLQHTRPPCPSPTPRAYPNPCPLSRWCHPTISSSVVSFSSCPQSFPASGSFMITQFLASGGQSIGVSTSTSVLPMNTQDWSPLGWTGWISLQSKGFSRVIISNTTVQKHQFFSAQLSL